MKICDLDALKKTMHNFFDGKVIDEPAYILRDVFYLIDSAPELGYEDGILSVENTTRRAIELEEAYNNGWSDGFTTHDCSICGHSKEGTHLQYNFCPNCGAKMKDGVGNG